MFYRLVILLLGIIFLYNITFAYERKNSDCNEKTISYYEALLGKGVLKGKKIITEDVYLTALSNLKKYCNNESNTLATPIFANHILDIGLRKLDGVKGLAYGVALDETAKSWRDFLNKVGDKSQTDPKIIAENFKKVRGEAGDNIVPSMKTLYGKHMLLCGELSSLMNVITTSAGQNNKVQIVSTEYLNDKCERLIKNIYKKESNLTQKIELKNFYTKVEKETYKGLMQKILKKVDKLYHTIMIYLGNVEYLTRIFIHALDVQTK